MFRTRCQGRRIGSTSSDEDGLQLPNIEDLCRLLQLNGVLWNEGLTVSFFPLGSVTADKFLDVKTRLMIYRGTSHYSKRPRQRHLKNNLIAIIIAAMQRSNASETRHPHSLPNPNSLLPFSLQITPLLRAIHYPPHPLPPTRPIPTILPFRIITSLLLHVFPAVRSH